MLHEEFDVPALKVAELIMEPLSPNEIVEALSAVKKAEVVLLIIADVGKVILEPVE